MSAGDEVARDGKEQRPAERLSLAQAAERALEQFIALSGFEPESLTGVKQMDGGWSLLVDVVEVERVPRR